MLPFIYWFCYNVVYTNKITTWEGRHSLWNMQFS